MDTDMLQAIEDRVRKLLNGVFDEAPMRRHIEAPPHQPSAEMIRAEARVWANMMRPLADMIGDRFIKDVLPDGRIYAALDEIDFGALRDFLEMVGKPPATN